MPRTILIFAILLLATLPAFAGGEINITDWSGREKVIIRWTGTDETGVSNYEVLRREYGNPREAAVFLATVPLDPTREYTFEDRTLFRTTGKVYIYTIKAIGTGKEYDVSIPFESVSGVRRTWGSIKAMFR